MLDGANAAGARGWPARACAGGAARRPPAPRLFSRLTAPGRRRSVGPVKRVWFFIGGRFWIYRLSDNRYEEVSRSVALPKLDLDHTARLVAATDEGEQADAVRGYRKSLQRRR